MKQTLKIKILATLIIITLAILGNTEIGLVKLASWLGLMILTTILALVFEKDLR